MAQRGQQISLEAMRRDRILDVFESKFRGLQRKVGRAIVIHDSISIRNLPRDEEIG